MWNWKPTPRLARSAATTAEQQATREGASSPRYAGADCGRGRRGEDWEDALRCARGAHDAGDTSAHAISLQTVVQKISFVDGDDQGL